jgi:hypothetical protein
LEYKFTRYKYDIKYTRKQKELVREMGVWSGICKENASGQSPELGKQGKGKGTESNERADTWPVAEMMLLHNV